MNTTRPGWIKLYRWLLARLPREFRKRNETELLAVFEDRVSHLAIRDVIRECIDLIGLAFTLRVDSSSRIPATEPSRSIGSGRLMSGNTVGELQQTLRGLLRTPTFSFSVLATMGFGLGTVSVVFTLAWGLWLSPLPFRNPDALVTISDMNDGSGGNISLPELVEYESASSLEGIGAYRYGALITSDPESPPARLTAYAVEPRVFSILGIAPALGRAFTADDISGRNGHVTVISNRLWQRRFASDKTIIGQRLTTSNGTFTIIGVMPARVEFPYWLPSDVWLPLDRNENTDRAARYYSAIGRLRSGVSIAAADAQLKTISNRLAAEYAATNRNWKASVGSLVEETAGSYRASLALLLGLVALLAGVSVANTTSLFVARRHARQHELAVRLALGATAVRLRRLVFMEAIFLAVGAAMLGIVIASLTARILVAILPVATPRLSEVRVSEPVLLMVMCVALTMGIVCGVLSSIGIARGDGTSAVHGGRGVFGKRSRLRGVLIVGEIALSVLLLVGAGLTTRAFVTVMRTDRGFEANGLATTHVTLPFENYQDDELRSERWASIQQRLAQLPGVSAVGLSTGYPGSVLGTFGGGPFASPDNTDQPVAATLIAASPGYFNTMHTLVKAGRDFRMEDRRGAAPVAIINDAMAKSMWPGVSPIGKRLRAPQGGYVTLPELEVVGVVANMKMSGRGSPIVYVPLSQSGTYWVDIMLRTDGNAESKIASLEAAVRELEPKMLVENSNTMVAFIGDRFALERAQSALSIMFGALATLLTAIGAYGLIATIVVQRGQEIAVRRAVGAPSSAIVATLIGRGATWGVFGVALGAVLVYATRQVLVRYLPSFSSDVGVVAYGGAAVMIVVLLACAAASVRALRIDPVRLLK